MAEENANVISSRASSPKKPKLTEEEKKARRGRNRERAVRELLSTEQTYVRLMANLVEHFVTKLRVNHSMLSKEDYQILFPSDIIVIKGLNQTFLEDLKKVIEGDWNNENTKIGHILTTFCPHFKMYQNYLNNYSKAATRLAQLRKKSSSSFSKYCDKQNEQKYFNNLPLESLIILPIQRIPRYNILLKEIIKNTESHHPDLDELKLALSKISEVNDTINNKIKEFDSRIKVQHIENRFNGKLTNLVTPARRYVSEGRFCKIDITDDQTFLFILFSDCILYASQSGNGDKLAFGNLLPFTSQFKIQRTPNHINRDRINNLFEMHTTKESFMLYAASRTEMTSFIDITQKTHAHHMSLIADKRESTSLQQRKKRVVYAVTLLIPNDFADRCMMRGCDTKFGLFTRRHHCLYCGYVVCNKCSLNELQPRPTHQKNATAEMVRVCDVCYKKCVPNKALSVLGKGSSSSKPPPALNKKQLTPKMMQLLGVKPGEFQKIATKEALKKRTQSMEEDLLKKYDKRAKQLHNDEIDDIEEEEEEEEAAAVKHDEDDMDPDDIEEDKDTEANDPPKQRRTAVLNFVKFDVEPRMIALETENFELQQKIAELTEVNVGLKTENHKMRKQLEEKEEIIKSLLNQQYEYIKNQENNDDDEKVSNKRQPPAQLPPPVPSDAIKEYKENMNKEDEKNTDTKRICTTCNKEIVGRALRTNGGLHHRECFVCSECGLSLAGKNYGLVIEENGDKAKICEECTNVDNASPRSLKARVSIDNSSMYAPVTVVD